MNKPFTLDRTVRLVITVSVIIALFLITDRLSGVLVPFLVSWFLAYLIHPIVRFFQYKCRLKHRTLSVIVTLLILVCVLGGVGFLLLTPITNELIRMGKLLATYVSNWQMDTILPESWEHAISQRINELDLAALFTAGNIETILQKITHYLGGIIGGGMSVLSGLFVLFVCVLYLVFILIDYEKISQGFIEAIPPKYRELISNIKTDLEIGMNKYFRGQSIIAFTVGVLFSIGFSIMGLPMAIVIGLFIGLLNMIPYMQGLGIPITMLLGLLQSAETGTAYWIILIEILAVFVIVQLIEDMLLVPLIMGNVIGMNPAIMLLSLSVWGSLLGVAGMIIALPLTTVIISYYKRYVLEGKELSQPPVEQQLSVDDETSPTV